MFLLNNVSECYDQFSAEAYAPGSVDKKNKELIAVACSVMADCVPCIEAHYKRAIAAGASREEISEALAVAMSICAGSKKAKYGPVIERLEQEI